MLERLRCSCVQECVAWRVRLLYIFVLQTAIISGKHFKKQRVELKCMHMGNADPEWRQQRSMHYAVVALLKLLRDSIRI
jgi:hypothetical protein